MPQARTAILEFFGLDGVSVTQVETLPEVDEHLEDLRARAHVHAGRGARARDVRGRPSPRATSTRCASPTIFPGGQVSFIWRDDDGEIELLLSEFRAGLDRDYVEKVAGPNTTIEQLEVNGEPALWLGGAPHAFGYLNPEDEFGQVELRLAGPTLLWQRGDAILRLEGDLTRDEAVSLAEQLD